MTNPLKSLCESVIEAASNVMKRPFTLEGIHLYSEGHTFGSYDGPEITGDYIVTAANSAETLAKALLIADEAMEKHSCCPSCEPCGGCKIHDAREKIREILGVK